MKLVLQYFIFQGGRYADYQKLFQSKETSKGNPSIRTKLFTRIKMLRVTVVPKPRRDKVRSKSFVTTSI